MKQLVMLMMKMKIILKKFIRESIENNNIDILKLLIEIVLINYDISWDSFGFLELGVVLNLT
jgi:hypothetical protein